MSEKIITVASRESKLAVAQAQLIIKAIAGANPQLTLSVVTMKTTGDKILDKSLDKIGGKGLFVKELDYALRNKLANITVHSLKDMPAEAPEDLPLLAFFVRGNPLDALVLPQGQTKIDITKPIGCGSARRVLQLKKLYPNIEVKLIRGNVQTRLAKLDSGEYCATVLACAGLERLGLTDRISRVFTAEEMLPAAGQGTLAVQGRAGEDYAFLREIDDKSTRQASLAERTFVRILDGGCSSPIAAYAEVKGKNIIITGLYCDENTGKYIKGSESGVAEDGEALAKKLALRLKNEVNL